MGVPFFFARNLGIESTTVDLDEDQSRHVVLVLRMNTGEKIRLTNGAGYAAMAEIIDPDKKNCKVRLVSSEFTPRKILPLTIAISCTKNASRFEWFLEKSAELGIAEVIPLICERTEKQHLRVERLSSICKSAMLQSGQVWMTVIQEPVPLKKVISGSVAGQKLFGYITPDVRSLSEALRADTRSRIIVVGPEGDFTPDEINMMLAHGFEGVSFGNSVLRVETAGVYAAVLHAAHIR